MREGCDELPLRVGRRRVWPQRTSFDPIHRKRRRPQPSLSFLVRPLDVQRFPDDSEMRRPAAATPGAYCGSESRSQRPKPRRGPARVLAQRAMRRRAHGRVDHRGSFRVAARGRGLEIRARRLFARLGSDASGERRDARGLRSGRAGNEASAVASAVPYSSPLIRLRHALS
jgi:hypothetical protein